MSRIKQRARIDAAVMAESPWAKFDEAMAKLREWDQQCREEHERFIADMDKLRADFDAAMNGGEA